MKMYSNCTPQGNLNYIQCPNTKHYFVKKLPFINFSYIWNMMSLQVDHTLSKHQFQKEKKNVLAKYSDAIRCNYSKCKDCRK